jgi:hypothetical protein
VEQLKKNETELGRVALNLNFDMTGKGGREKGEKGRRRGRRRGRGRGREGREKGGRKEKRTASFGLTITWSN